MQQHTSFEVYAPGKVILTGEHAVVYQKDAVSIAIDKYTRLSCEILQCSLNDNIYCNVKLKDIDSSFIIEKGQMISLCLDGSVMINTTLTQYKESICKAFGSVVETKEHFILIVLIIINYFLNKTNQQLNCNEIKKDIIQFIQKNKINIVISSDIPIGFGLGSSSAYNVAIVNCFSFIFRKALSINENEVTKDDLISLANIGEQYFHSTPSGIDVTTCINGGMVHYINIKNNNLISNYQTLFDNFNVMLINTGEQRIAKKFIIKVSQYKTNHHDDFIKAIDSIQQIALKIKSIIANSSIGTNINDHFTVLSGLIIENQRLLKQIMVSNNLIDHICFLLEDKGIPAKITGAGGGGYIFALVSSEQIDTFTSIMNENKYSYFKLQPSTKGSFITITNL